VGGNRRSIETLGTSSTFLHDLGLSANALVSAPLMVILTMIIAVAAAAFGHFGPAAIMVQIVLAGFVGVQRIWFLRVWRKSTLELHELAPLTWRFMGRYIALALTVGVMFGAPFLIVGPALLRNEHVGAVIAISVVVSLIVDFLLTFVTPALAYTTRSVREAVRIGTRMIASTWPSSAWYVLTPGLALTSFAFLLHSRSTSLLVAAVTSVVALWFKGAVAAFYLRIHPELDGFGA
jgi:hypothetical protein